MKEDELIRAWNHVNMSEEKKTQLKETLRMMDKESATMRNTVYNLNDFGNKRRLIMLKTKKRIAVLAAAVIMVLG